MVEQAQKPATSAGAQSWARLTSFRHLHSLTRHTHTRTHVHTYTRTHARTYTRTHTHSINSDRDTLFSSGAVSHMLDLILSSRSTRARTDACDALFHLLKSDSACRAFVLWQGKSPLTGDVFESGLAPLFLLRREASPSLQRAGVAVIGAVLLSEGLKHSDRVGPVYMAGLCDYGYASDELAAKEAMTVLSKIAGLVLDKGIR
jgi:hypothetical protein